MNKLFSIVLCSTALVACSQTKKQQDSPAGYDFNAPVKQEMVPDLKEISGNTFHPDDPSTMYAIQDEDGKLFYWNINSPQNVQHVKFGKHGDYEDVAMAKDYVVVLRSDGVLITFPYAEVKTGVLNSVKEWGNLIPDGEYESLFFDRNSEKLIILCKNCDADRGKNAGISGYELQLKEGGSPVLTGKFTINTENLKSAKGKSKGRIRPSAVAFNNKTKEWFILASVNHLLIVADERWNIKQSVTLDQSLFPQPEGISFDIDNNLYISNEAGNTPNGTLLKFPYRGLQK
jgi:hypothetical protein